MNYITFEYRDAANYRWSFTVSITDEKLKQLDKKYKHLVEGTELNYDTDLGITQEEFHEKRGFPYDDEIDHNIIEVLEVSDKLPENENCAFEIK